ncbi:Hpt domain-containing protein [Rehaibacterium terrae]|uniref:Chemotaxis protein CheA n=1 Tax=Rehaibacterium terrae TaxID=1341696 RepID=A0A7W8DES9_9GAMM|nr:Hpt domain-containing protein [Rehaibacterium terrae]MBB5015902.1 chemosensory pili system protein ChpA (sensor histidine kinase/response regulator) [Rehaibacterium terrae]
MRLHDDIDHITLGWVKPELDETLRQARHALEAHVETPGDPNWIRACAGFLHQVSGTLRMVELYGAAMVAEEMEHLARALAAGAVADRDEAYTVLMRGIVQLPDYLERLQSGHKDVPIVLLPLLNELRAARGEQGVPESVLFSPVLDAELPASARGPDAPLPEAVLRDQAEVLRVQFQSALLRWLKNGENPDTISALAAVCDRLVGVVRAESARRLFWVAAGTLEALQAGAFEASKPLKQALARVEREIKRLADGGEAAFRSDPPLELTRQLLYFVAHAPTDHGRIGEMREVFQLNRYVPSQSELEHAQSSMTGHNRELLDTVSAAIKEDLLRVKDVLDLHLRGGGSDTDLSAQTEVLDRVADTLGMLGLGVPRRVVQEQRDAIAAVAGGSRPADETTLLDIAGALLYVEASLDDQVARLGQPESDIHVGPGAPLPGAEAQRLLDAVIKEAISDFSLVRQAFVAYVETSWDANQLADVPRLLDEVAGALRILELEEAPAYLRGIERFTRIELLDHRRVPDARQLDTLADALTSIEYYLEALRDHRARRDSILTIARDSLASLGYWPLPASARAEAPPPASAATPTVAPSPAASAPDGTSATTTDGPVATFTPPTAADDALREAPAPAADADAAAVPDRPAEAAQATEVAEAAEVAGEAAPAAIESSQAAPTRAASAEAPPATPVPAPVTGGFDSAIEDIDDEIREVFLEEFQEEIANLDRLLPSWRSQPENLELLRSIRRVFHTLKGSGRLVGALTLGEFSWKIENMLNRVLDGTRQASPAMVALLDAAHRALPQLHAALRGEQALVADLAAIQDAADRFVAGEEVLPEGMVVPPVEVAADDEPPLAEPASPATAAAEPAPEAAAEDESSGVVAAVDPVLLEILKVEVAGHLQTIQGWLDQCASGPVAASDALLRAVHTTNGAFAMTEVPLITEVTAPLESYIKRLLAHSSLPSPRGVALVAEAADAIRRVIAALERTRPVLPALGDLPARMAAERDTLPEPQRPTLPGWEPEEHEEAEALLPRVVDLEAPDTSALPELPADDMSPPATAATEPVAAEPDAASGVAAEAGAGSATHAGSTAAVAETPDDSATRDEDLERAIEAMSAGEELAGSPPEADEPARPPMSEADPFAGYTEEEAAELAALFAAEARGNTASGGAPAEAETVETAAVETEPAEVEPAEVEAVETKPVEAEAAEAEAAEAEAVEAEAVEAEAAEAEAVEAEAVEAEAAEAEAVEAEAVEAEPAEVEPAEVEPAEVEPAETEAVETEAVETEAVETEPVEAEAVEAEAVEAEAVEPARAASALGDVALAVHADDPDPDAPLDMSDIDPDLLDIFLEESADLLDHADGQLALLRENPSEREPVIALQRDLHTLKGGARMAGIQAVGELGHAMESLLEAVAENRRELDKDGLNLLERGFDRLHGMVQRVARRLAVALPATLIGQVEALVHARPPAAATAPLSTPGGAARPLPPLSAPLHADALPDEDDIGGTRAPQELVRIRADLLDRLVNYAGEVAIYRARLEQQLGAFRSNLGELDQTTGRLRDQLRKLEIETEAQIIARYQREHDDTDESFDPLELDRFSTLQQLTRALAESAADLASLQDVLDDLTRQHETLLLQQSRVSSDLQEGLMRTRMVPFDALVPRLRRVLRQAAAETGKQVQLRVEGAQGEMDRNVLERMTAPLEHMLRNAVAHGLESPNERRRAGKPEEGTVRVTVAREGSEVVISVSDDGRGLDAEAIRRKAVERGLLDPEAQVGEQQLYGFILETGFSTAETVNRLAGRGVGMDVVHSEIRQLGGSLQIASKPGQGSTFTIRLPFTLAVTQAVFVRIGETSYAVPIASVQGVGRISRQELEAQLVQERPVYRYAGEDYAIHDLGRLLGHASAKAQESLQMPLLLTRSGDVRTAICIDQVIGSREIVVKPVGPQVSSIPGIFGATVMGDGSVVVILDIAPLVRRQALAPVGEAPVSMADVRRVPLVMVVDDSITMRKVTSRVLERHNFEVVTAKDGVDAIEKMAERVPDLMLLDIEMPRMDGYELATHMRNDARLRAVPIVMITSRSGEKHRQRAFEIGVNRYLGKPYQEAELMSNVFDLVGPVRGHA